MSRVVLDRIVQIPDATARRPDEILHRAIFEECCLERAFLADAAKMISRARGAGPNLRDITVAAVQHREARFRTHDAPVRIVNEAMRRDITTHVATSALVVCLHVAEDLLQRA